MKLLRIGLFAVVLAVGFAGCDATQITDVAPSECRPVPTMGSDC